MALRKLNKMVETHSIGPKKGELKSFAGFLVGAKYEVGKTKTRKGNTVWIFQTEKGERAEIWGSASINGGLAIDGKLDPSLAGKWIEIHFVRMGVAQKGKNAQKIADVMCDDAKVMPVKKLTRAAKG